MNKNSMHIQVTAEKPVIAYDNPTRRVVEIKLQAPSAVNPQVKRQSLNLGLIIDRSGSMSGDKIEYAKQAARHVIGMLKPGDRAGLTIYDDQSEQVMPNVVMNDANRTQFLSAIDGISSRGSTNLFDGWLMGCEAVAQQMTSDQVNRVLLLSDGLANQGITSIDQLGQHASALHERGIATSTFGVGSDFSEQLLERMSSQGGGNFYFIEHPRQIPEIFLSELKELVQVTAKSAELTCTLPSGSKAEVLGGWRHTSDDTSLHIFLGDMVAMQERSLFLVFDLPPQVDTTILSLSFLLSAVNDAGETITAQHVLDFRFATLLECEQAPYDKDMMSRYGRVHLSDTTREALLLEKMGKRSQAQAMMASAINNTSHYLNSADAVLFNRRSERIQEGLSEEERKRMHYNTYRRSRSREIDSSEEQNEE